MYFDVALTSALMLGENEDLSKESSYALVGA